MKDTDEETLGLLNGGGDEEHPDPSRLTYEDEKAAQRLRGLSTFRRALIRVPALVATLVIELFVAFVIAEYADSNIFTRYPLLISFQPVLSAISGNIGLQASSIHVRELQAGIQKDRKNLLHGMLAETRVSALLSICVGIALFVISLVWYSPAISHHGHTWHGAAVFAVAIGCGQFLSAMMAAVTGSAAPLLFDLLGYDPASFAGPMETAVQDVIGGTLMLVLSAGILRAAGDASSDKCPWGTLVDCMNGCAVNVTDVAPFHTYNQTCLDTCAADCV